MPYPFAFSGKTLAAAINVELQRQDYIRLHQLKRSNKTKDTAKATEHKTTQISITLGWSFIHRVQRSGSYLKYVQIDTQLLQGSTLMCISSIPMSRVLSLKLTASRLVMHWHLWDIFGVQAEIDVSNNYPSMLLWQACGFRLIMGGFLSTTLQHLSLHLFQKEECRRLVSCVADKVIHSLRSIPSCKLNSWKTRYSHSIHDTCCCNATCPDTHRNGAWNNKLEQIGWRT